MEIRLATIADVPALDELVRQSVSALSVEYYSAQQISSALLHVFGVDTQLILDGTYFIAEVEKQIAGSGGWSKRKTLFGGDQKGRHQSWRTFGAPVIDRRITPP